MHVSTNYDLHCHSGICSPLWENTNDFHYCVPNWAGNSNNKSFHLEWRIQWLPLNYKFKEFNCLPLKLVVLIIGMNTFFDLILDEEIKYFSIKPEEDNRTCSVNMISSTQLIPSINRKFKWRFTVSYAWLCINEPGSSVNTIPSMSRKLI